MKNSTKLSNELSNDLSKLQSWLILLGAVSFTIFLISCSNDKNKNVENQQYPTSPTSMACLYGAAACDSNQYAQYYGFMAYPGNQTIYVDQSLAYTYGANGSQPPQNGLGTTLCNCPQGTRPVYSGLIGMGCVNESMIMQFNQGVYYYGQSTLSTNGYQYVNWNQISNINGAGGANGCYSDLAWACFVDVASSCFQGYTCRPTVTNSRLGICTR